MISHREVLDHGYVRLLDVMGSDLTVVNAARASFAKRSSWEGDSPGNLRRSDQRLIEFLAKHGHMSPFRHVTLQFEVKAPLMVARQWWKYVVGGDHTMDGWNETSRRYVTGALEFYRPEQWRTAAANRKQGSAGVAGDHPAQLMDDMLARVLNLAVSYYECACELGIAPEQARLLLPMYGLYTSWYWTTSLQGLTHFLNQRLADDAQWEIQQYARAVRDLLDNVWALEHSFKVLLKPS